MTNVVFRGIVARAIQGGPNKRQAKQERKEQEHSERQEAAHEPTALASMEALRPENAALMAENAKLRALPDYLIKSKIMCYDSENKLVLTGAARAIADTAAGDRAAH